MTGGHELLVHTSNGSSFREDINESSTMISESREENSDENGGISSSNNKLPNDHNQALQKSNSLTPANASDSNNYELYHNHHNQTYIFDQAEHEEEMNLADPYAAQATGGGYGMYDNFGDNFDGANGMMGDMGNFDNDYGNGMIDGNDVQQLSDNQFDDGAAF